MHGSCDVAIILGCMNRPYPAPAITKAYIDYSTRRTKRLKNHEESSVVHKIYFVKTVIYVTVSEDCYLLPRLLELLHELLVELDDTASPVRSRSEESCPEMQCAFLLSESCTGNDADTSSVQHAEAVELIRCATFLLGLLYSLLWEVDGREKVHGALLMILAVLCVADCEIRTCGSLHSTPSICLNASYKA